MYTETNFKTKKQFKEALAAGKEIRVYSPGPFPAPTSGWTTIEGPHYPEPHRWYARAYLENGVVTRIK